MRAARTAPATRATRLALLALACLIAAGARAQSGGAAQSPAARGIELYQRGDYEAAIKSLREAAKRQKADADVWQYLGLAFVKKGKFKDARKSFEEAVRLRPNFPAALTGLAYVHLRFAEDYDAAAAAERALALDPASMEARYIRGVTRLRADSNADALAEAETALKRDPAFAPALYLKVLALAGLSANAVSAATDETQDVRRVLLDKAGARIDEAEVALRKFAELDPKHAEIESLREQLKTLRVYRDSFGASPSGGDIMSAREVTTRARITGRPEPLYTERARQNMTRGRVVLRMVLAADGTVKHIVAVRRLPDGLTEAAISAARRIKFLPATKNGRPVSQYATIQYSFNIY